MKTQVEFRSDKFPAYADEEEQINPGLWGQRLAEYFVEKLPAHGITTEEIIAEDWGWYVPIQSVDYPIGLCCGHQYGDPDQFLVFTDPGNPIVKKLFSKIDCTEQLEQLTRAMDQILKADPEIREVVWTEPN